MTGVLHSLPALRLGRTFPSVRSDYPSVSLLHLITRRWYRNFNLLSIIYAFRPRLRSRLTLGGRTFPRKLSTGRFLASLSLLMPAFSLLCSPPPLPIRLLPAYIAPLPIRIAYPQASVSGLSPGNLRRTITRPVSYYALF